MSETPAKLIDNLPTIGVIDEDSKVGEYCIPNEILRISEEQIHIISTMLEKREGGGATYTIFETNYHSNLSEVAAMQITLCFFEDNGYICSYSKEDSNHDKKMQELSEDDKKQIRQKRKRNWSQAGVHYSSPEEADIRMSKHYKTKHTLTVNPDESR
jgi:hypothetical protein